MKIRTELVGARSVGDDVADVRQAGRREQDGDPQLAQLDLVAFADAAVREAQSGLGRRDVLGAEPLGDRLCTREEVVVDVGLHHVAICRRAVAAALQVDGESRRGSMIAASRVWSEPIR